MNKFLQRAYVPKWMTKGRTTLIQKDPSKGTAPKNYRPIPCLPMMWKILTAQIREDVICSYTASQRHNNKDAITKTQEGRRRKTSLQIYFTSHFIARVRKGCSRVACERKLETEHNCNILTPLLWPSRCVFLVLLMLGSTPSGFPRAPSVGCGFPHHIWSLAVWNSTGNCFLDSNSTELNNNSTPTRSPTGSLKSNV